MKDVLVVSQSHNASDTEMADFIPITHLKVADTDTDAVGISDWLLAMADISI